jgi:hypothetical protein
VRSLARAPWKLTSILYPMIVAALLPLSLRDALRKLPDIAARLEASEADGEILQVPRFRQGLAATPKARSRKNR